MVLDRLSPSLKYLPLFMMAELYQNPQIVDTPIGSELANLLFAPPCVSNGASARPEHRRPHSRGYVHLVWNSLSCHPVYDPDSKSRAMKIVDPHTHKELKLEPVKMEIVDLGTLLGLESAGRSSCNGLIRGSPLVGFNPQH